MTENTSTEDAKRDLGRRSVLKGAAWSVPVIAAVAVAPLAAASVNGSILRPEFSGSTPLSLVVNVPIVGAVTVAQIDVPTTLTIYNDGTVASTAGDQVIFTYPDSLLDVSLSGLGVSVLPGSGSPRTIVLPSIPAGGSVTIDVTSGLLGFGSVVAALNVLNGLLGSGENVMTATIPANSNGTVTGSPASAEVGITILAVGP